MERWRIRTSHKVTQVLGGRSWARTWLPPEECTLYWKILQKFLTQWFPSLPVFGEEYRLTEMLLVGGQMLGLVAVGWMSLPTCDPLFPLPLSSSSQHQAELPTPTTAWEWWEEPEEDHCQPCPHGEGVQGYEWSAEVLFLFCLCPFGRNLLGERHQGLRTEVRTPPPSEFWLLSTHSQTVTWLPLWKSDRDRMAFRNLSFLYIYLTPIILVLNHREKTFMVTAVLFINLISNWTSCLKTDNRMIATPVHNCRLKIVNAMHSLLASFSHSLVWT